MIKTVIISTFVLLTAMNAWATELSPDQKTRAQALFMQIRCPVCTAQPVAESDASLSYALRAHVETAIIAGQTDAEILEDLTQTYGDDIRLLPKTEPRTLPLWLAPWLVLAIGAFGIVIVRARKRKL